MNFFRLFSAIVIVFSVFACSGKTAVKPEDEFNAEKMLDQANKLIDSKEFNDARAMLLQIRNRDLTKQYAPLAQLRLADSYIKEEEPDSAIAEYRKFIDMYPDHRYASYAQYQIAMVYFDEIEGPDRGYGGADLALKEFEKLKKNYPRNPYMETVDLRIERCKNIIADYEFLVGSFYLKKMSYRAALDRFEGLVIKYPEYKKMDQTLLNIALCYKNLGQNDKAAAALKQLVEKYPSSPIISQARKELAALDAAKK